MGYSKLSTAFGTLIYFSSFDEVVEVIVSAPMTFRLSIPDDLNEIIVTGLVGSKPGKVHIQRIFFLGFHGYCFLVGSFSMDICLLFENKENCC
jgi:hypothetical protein